MAWMKCFILAWSQFFCFDLTIGQKGGVNGVNTPSYCNCFIIKFN